MMINRTFGSALPEWVKEGEDVAVVTPSRGTDRLQYTVRRATVERANKVFVQVSETDRKFSVKRGLEAIRPKGDSGYMPNPFLADPKDPDVLDAIEAQRVYMYAQTAIHAVDRFRKDFNLGDARKAAYHLTQYVAHKERKAAEDALNQERKANK